MGSKGIFKNWLILTISAVFLYGALMIVVRLKITELGYEFEEAKAYERALSEEQGNLRATLAKLLANSNLRAKLRAKGLSEPDPKQMVVIP